MPSGPRSPLRSKSHSAASSGCAVARSLSRAAACGSCSTGSCRRRAWSACSPSRARRGRTVRATTPWRLRGRGGPRRAGRRSARGGAAWRRPASLTRSRCCPWRDSVPFPHGTTGTCDSLCESPAGSRAIRTRTSGIAARSSWPYGRRPAKASGRRSWRDAKGARCPRPGTRRY